MNASWKICSLVVNRQSFLLIDGYLLNFFHESANEKKSKQPIHGRNLTDNRLLTKEIVCKVRTQQAENFDEEVKSLVSAWFLLSTSSSRFQPICRWTAMSLTDIILRQFLPNDPLCCYLRTVNLTAAVNKRNRKAAVRLTVLR